MKCRKCGGESPADAKFCVSCGAELGGNAYYENPVQTEPSSGYGVHNMYANALIKSVKSPVYLVALILNAISAVGVLLCRNLYGRFIESILLESDNYIDYVVNYRLPTRIMTATMVYALIPAIIFIVGMILVRVGASKGDLSLMRAGLKTIKILKIVQCVFACLGLAILVLWMVIVLIVAAAMPGGEELVIALATGMLIVLILIFGAVIAVSVVSYIVMFRSLGSAIAITRMEPGDPARIRRIPGWYGIFVIVMGVIGGINIASILFGINLMNFSEEINRLPYTEK